MALTAEHQFISLSLDTIITKYSKSLLFGINESQRRTFDYSCILLRDFTRPLVSQVMWGHSEGVEKDIRTLLHDVEASIKVYVVKDHTRNRARLEEIITSYKAQEPTKRLLAGLRIIFIPPDFDADKEYDREWLSKYLENRFSKDILFAIVFGHFTSFDFNMFAQHGGPIGLKYLILDEITKNSLQHMPTFKERIGYKTTGTIREALTMLSALGLVKTLPASNAYFPALKGRLLLDLTRKVLFEKQYCDDWSDELKLVFSYLNVLVPTQEELQSPSPLTNFTATILYGECCNTLFGRDLLADIDPKNPVFYSDYQLPDVNEIFYTYGGFTKRFFSEPESLFFIDED